MSEKQTVVALVRNRPGVLTRVAGLFRRRMFNIESLAVGHCERPGMSRMTIGIDGDEQVVDAVLKQFMKLIDVVESSSVSAAESVQRELALIKVNCPPGKRTEIIPLIDIFRASVIDVAPDTLIVEVVGGEDKVDKMIALLSPYGIVEVVRTGRVAMRRGDLGDLAAATPGQIRAIGA